MDHPNPFYCIYHEVNSIRVLRGRHIRNVIWDLSWLGKKLREMKPRIGSVYDKQSRIDEHFNFLGDFGSKYAKNCFRL